MVVWRGGGAASGHLCGARVDLASGRRSRRLPPVPEGSARTRLRQTVHRSGAALRGPQQQHPHRKGTRATACSITRRQGVGAHQHRVLPSSVRRGARGRAGHVAAARRRECTRDGDRRAISSVFARAKRGGAGPVRTSSRPAHHQAPEDPGAFDDVGLHVRCGRASRPQPARPRGSGRASRRDRAPRCGDGLDAHSRVGRNGVGDSASGFRCSRDTGVPAACWSRLGQRDEGRPVWRRAEDAGGHIMFAALRIVRWASGLWGGRTSASSPR